MPFLFKINILTVSIADEVRIVAVFQTKQQKQHTLCVHVLHFENIVIFLFSIN